ncbi:hypothetical protein CC78DRAFT_531340 [Lojkania enalia]|uniref:DNA replication regulator Sld3 C-terminal domain-containing protein n=1 Tax=Lojkania enalia TaxID=147567 RepID=A0A9P4KFD2_9PLEO|nr:hypothetical protein CC78DRAFT_531340 [Didymosphaeria enalia]
MSPYTLSTKTVPQSLSKDPAKILGRPPKHNFESKAQLPTKRKRDSICGLGAFNKSFTIKSRPELPYDKPSTFRPIRIIGRSQLPFTFLDTSPDSDFAPNRLFSADIEILEKPYNANNVENPPQKILIARYETNKLLYAIERVQPHVFSLCKLANWLKEKDVGDLWDPAKLALYPRHAEAEQKESEGEVWWKQATLQTLPDERPQKRVRIAMLLPKPEIIESEVSLAHSAQAVSEDTRIDQNTIHVPGDVPVAAPSPQQLLENLVQQYLDAVYMSKTSLAYFVKGPITRIRMAFTSPEGVPPTCDLVTFLRSMLLSHKASDKKYREKLPDVIRSIPLSCYSDDDAVDGASKTRKLKQKLKLSREGVYPQERDVIKKWWMSELPNLEIHGEETLEQRIKRRIGDLRVRETLGQMILMLEILALEALSAYKEPLEDVQTHNAETQSLADTQAKPKKRKRKLDDIKLQLDLLLDKLCIWQSVDQDEIFDFDAIPSHTGEGPSGKDRLQSFCVEVIVPFYMNRLPEQARMISKKLGGPVHTSPPKRKAMKPPKISQKSGEPKEPEPKKARRSFGRVLTDTTTRVREQRATPSLNRSVTDSALVHDIKREGSEIPLTAIPLQRSPSAAARQSMSYFNLLKGRQIDLSTPTAGAAAKLKQKKRVEEDLKEAISALKKPNRSLAAGSYADDIERRRLGLTNKSRKPANPVRKIIKDVQVSATPRVIKRTKDAIGEQTPVQQRNPFVRDNVMDAPLSSNFCIPSSVVHLTSSNPGTVHTATARSSAGHSVAETPTRAPNNKVFLTSAASRRMLFATPIKDRAPLPCSSKTPTAPPDVLTTPIKTTTAIAASPFPIFSNPAKGNDEASIYDALGWNDDDDFL